MLEDGLGVNHHTHAAIAIVATNFYEDLLGKANQVIPLPVDLQLPMLNNMDLSHINRPFRPEEVLKTDRKSVV